MFKPRSTNALGPAQQLASAPASCTRVDLSNRVLQYSTTNSGLLSSLFHH